VLFAEHVDHRALNVDKRAGTLTVAVRSTWEWNGGTFDTRSLAGTGTSRVGGGTGSSIPAAAALSRTR